MKPSSIFRACFVLMSMLALNLTIPAISQAQNPDTLKAAVPYNVFPMGGMIGAPNDTMQKMLGANFTWNGFGSETSLGTLAEEGLLTDTTVTFRDPFYYDTTAAHSVAQSAYGYAAGPGYLLDAASAIDMRIFMPGTSGITKEYDHSWATNLGNYADTSTKVEWKIPATGMTSGQYVLSGLDGSAQNDAFSPGGYGDQVLNPDHVGSTSYEFVFFFNSTDLSGVSGTTPLYSLEFWHTGAGVSTMLTSVSITKNLWNSLSPQSASTQVLGRNIGAENLGNWKGQNINTYRLLRQIIDTRTLGITGSVDVRLKTFAQIPIYVRLLRIRDWRAQRLLTGKADSVLHLVVNALLAKGDNAHKNSWTIGNEPQPKTFHAWAYINDLLAKYNAPRANVLAPYAPDEFTRVMRDQSQNSVPGHLWYEWTPSSGYLWKDEGGPDTSVYSKWDLASYGALPNPIPGDVASDSNYWQARGVFIQKDYNTYTNVWQNSILGHPSEVAGGWMGTDQTMLSISQSCYETDPLHPIPFDLMAQSLCAAAQKPKWSPADSLYWVRGGNNVSSALTWVDTAYNSLVIAPYLARHPGQTHIPEDSIYDVDWNWRPPTVSEFYFGLWTGIAHGMKGFGNNILYDDGAAQNGLVWDSANIANLLIKTQDRKYIEFNFGGSLWNPYQMFNSSLWYESGGYTTYETLPPAYRTMFTTVRTLISSELGPIAAVLAVLNWNGAVSWPWRDSTPTYFSRLPVKSVQTRSLTGSLDSANQTYVDFGIHKHPNDTTAVYITMQNRRLWTDSLGTSTVDSRKVSFKIDTAKFPGYASWTEW